VSPLAIQEEMKLRRIGIVVAEELTILLERLLSHPPTRGVRNPMPAEVSDLSAFTSLDFPAGEEEQRQTPTCRRHCCECRYILFFAAVDENTRIVRGNSGPGQVPRCNNGHDVSSAFRT
jgi:hypothetical protein